MNRFHFSWLVGLFVATSPGCDRTVPVGSMDGTTCSDVGATKSPSDGCNTCTCGADHTWSCTARDCQCTPGTTKIADDGCNNCSCGADGNWGCTLMACGGAGGTTGSGGATATGGSTGTQATCCLAMAICTDGDLQISGPDACPAGASCYSNSICCSTVWCAKGTAQCDAIPVCDAGDTQIDGICPPDGSCYGRSLCGTTINCRKSSISCVPGSRKVDVDGCNTCTCGADGSTLSCTDMACALCTPGATKVAADGCNDCTCSTGGVWACTQKFCSAEACTAGKSQYQDLRTELLTKYSSLGCTTDSECSLAYESNRCIANCGTAIATIMASSFSSNLAAAAESYCTSCSAMAVPPCLPLVAQCVNGTCVTGVAFP